MKVKQKILSFFWNCISSIVAFFTEKDVATRPILKKLDFADIFIALTPLAFFGCLLFGMKAVAILAVCVVIMTGFDFLWDLLIMKSAKKELNYSAILMGLILGLTMSSQLNILIVIAVAVLSALLAKTAFKDKPMYLIFPILITRVVLGLLFFKYFNIYFFPFMNAQSSTVPLDYLFKATSFVYPAKYLFFGLHSGNIGETSVLLLLVGGIYLMIRKIINPIIPTCYVLTVGVLALIFDQNIVISLLGGSLFFAAFILTLDYSFKTTARYKKILYGILCGVLTFFIRLVFKTEGALIAVLVANFILIYVNRRNIKRVLRFIKNPDFKKLFNKFKRLFSA